MELLQQERCVPGKWATIEPHSQQQGNSWCGFLSWLFLIGVKGPDFFLASDPERLFLCLISISSLTAPRKKRTEKPGGNQRHLEGMTFYTPGSRPPLKKPCPFLLWAHHWGKYQPIIRGSSHNLIHLCWFTIFREKTASEISLRFRRHPTNYSEAEHPSPSGSSVGKTSWREICGWARVILSTTVKGFGKLTAYVMWNLTRKTLSHCYPDRPHPKAQDSLSSAELMLTPYHTQVLVMIIHCLDWSTSSWLMLLICFFLKNIPRESGNFA